MEEATAGSTSRGRRSITSGRKRWTGRRIRRQVISAAALLMLAGCAPSPGGCAPIGQQGATTSTTVGGGGSTTTSTSTSTSTTSTTSTTVPTSGTIPVEAVRAGICFAPDGGGQFVNKVIATSCDGPHQMEAFAAYELPDGDYPGNDELRRSTYDRCQDWFEDYVGIGFWDSRYDISAITPSPSTWADGDRSVVCVVVDVDGKALDAPARNSGV